MSTNNDDIDNVTNWVREYYLGYEKFMIKNHPELYNKFYMNIHPPQMIGGGIGIMQGKIHSDKDYAEIMRISKEFCEKYEHPINFPKEF